MNYWLLSDTHFGHNKMVRDGLRPEGYEDTVLDAIKKFTQIRDILIHLGDVAFYDVMYWHNVLLSASNARRNILLIGNHDRDTLTKYYSLGWDFVCDEFKLNIYGETILFSHIPAENRTDYTINIHGHYHDDDHRFNGKLPDNQRLVYTNLVTLKSIIGK